MSNRSESPLRFLTWNLTGASGDRAGRLVDLLAEEAGDGPTLAALQEVKPATFRALEASRVFDWLVHSLDIRAPGPFDRGNRKLGCFLAGRGDIELIVGDVLWRLPLRGTPVAHTFRAAMRGPLRWPRFPVFVTFRPAETYRPPSTFPACRAGCGERPRSVSLTVT